MEVNICEGKLVYSQESDSCDPNDLGQYLEVSIGDAGGGKYMIIKTERWAFDTIPELTEIITDAAKRMEINGK